MKKAALICTLMLSFFILSIPLARAEDMPAPFGFVVDQTKVKGHTNISHKHPTFFLYDQFVSFCSDKPVLKYF